MPPGVLGAKFTLEIFVCITYKIVFPARMTSRQRRGATTGSRLAKSGRHDGGSNQGHKNRIRSRCWSSRGAAEVNC
ncbi:hypothetical protein E2C01_062750 [Portunus trituberculatus]|uniref:Uncharacterized protein n=1 Tax=Portunus trituberculatus TaxID=210409 RepID=A0A5B7HI68_PORTR|nr:hypothetical protein [Portunus trituberculatus]